MYRKRTRAGYFVGFSGALTATVMLLATASCHRISTDRLPDNWNIEDTPRSVACTDISGSYCDQAIERTSECYTGRDDRVEKCTPSLSRALLGERVKYSPDHVQIEQSDSRALSVKLWKGEALLQEGTLRSEQDEFRCISGGVRIYWTDAVVVAPPFVSIVDYEYGTFQRAGDGALIMKRSDNDLFFMWGFIPWVTSIDAQWVKWEPYREGGVCKVTSADEKAGENVRSAGAVDGLAAEAGQGEVDAAAVLAVNNGVFAFLEALAETDAVAQRSLELIRYGMRYRGQPLAGLTDAELRRRALEGNPEACYQLYWNGAGPDPHSWLCRAADLGHNGARHRLGLLYWYGSEGVAKDPVRAYVWYSLAAEVGNANAWKETRRMRRDVLTAGELAQGGALVRAWQAGQCERDIIRDKPVD